MTGRVVSVKLKDTVTVLVQRVAMHPLYKKTFIRSKKYLAHTLLEVAEGDLVEIVNCKPVSKNKHWKVVKVVGRNLEEITEEKLKKQAEVVISEVMPEEKESEQVAVDSEQKEKKAEKPKRKAKLSMAAVATKKESK